MEYLLFITVIALLVERYFNDRSHAKEREDLIRAVLSKDIQEYNDSKIVPEVQEEKEVPPQFTAIEDLDQEQFNNAIYGNPTK